MATKKTTSRTSGTGGSRTKKKAVRKKAVAKKTSAKTQAKKATRKKTTARKKTAGATAKKAPAKKKPLSPSTAPRAATNGSNGRSVATGRPSSARGATTTGDGSRWSDRLAGLLVRHADATRALAERLRQRGG